MSKIRETADEWQATALKRLAETDYTADQKRQIADEMWLTGAFYGAVHRESWLSKLSRWIQQKTTHKAGQP